MIHNSSRRLHLLGSRKRNLFEAKGFVAPTFRHGIFALRQSRYNVRAILRRVESWFSGVARRVDCLTTWAVFPCF
jgi:hypothetical protein